MSRQHSRPSRHESPHEQHLREIVDVLVPEDPQKPAYLAFALEFAMSLRHGPQLAGIPEADPGDSPRWDSPRIPATVPDFEPGTKRVVLKFFERGLHGHTLWLVGQAVMREQTW